MHLYDHTAAAPAANLALDEALLLDPSRTEALRFWESPTPIVVMGRSTRLKDEVNVASCDRLAVPVLRRVSGGASIVAGGGCLMYAVVLDVERRPEIADIGNAHRFVLQRLVEAIGPIEPTIQVAGTSDLAYFHDGALHKCSGNSMRRARGRLLYHGTLLYAFDLPLLSDLLLTAPRQPAYRGGRDHRGFVANLNASRDDLKRRLAGAWNASPASLPDSVLAATEQLTHERYLRDDWNADR